jgi:hypothetical protein
MVRWFINIEIETINFEYRSKKFGSRIFAISTFGSNLDKSGLISVYGVVYPGGICFNCGGASKI